MDELISSSARAMALAIRSGKISAGEFVRAHLDRIAAVNPSLNAIVQLAADRALEEARQSDEALSRGEIQGPLHGVPVTFKDAIETAGIISTGGTAGRASFVPPQDAATVKRLRAAGAIVLGKTNCPELGWAWESDNLIYGRTNNPYDLSLSPGGSSGGESAIIAAGGSPLGLGSDAGGSVRFPAHCTGIAGIKPTSGRVPRTGHFPGPGGALDALWQIGPLARYVEDLTLVLPLLVGPDWRDAAVVPMPLGDPKACDLAKLRVAFYCHNGVVAPAEEIAESVKNAAAAVESEVSSVEEALPAGMDQTYELFLGLFTADGGAGIEAALASAGTINVHPLTQRVLEIQRANAKSTAAFGALLARWDSFRREMLSFLENYDVILCPVCAFAGMVHGSTYDRLPAFSYTMTYNLTGWPAAVVRAGTSSAGLPIGIQVVGRPWREDIVLAVAQLLEAALGGWKAPPI